MERISTRTLHVLALVLAAALALSPALWADKRPYTFDRAHSQVNFVAEALLLTAHGFYEKWDADVQIDADNIENSSVSFTIDAASINTRNERRDNHLRSADFFDVANHSNITFVSKSVRRVDDRNIVITGDLTIRGVTKEIQAPTHVVFLREGRGRFKGEFQINRKEFGVSYDSRGNPIEDTVKVQFDLNVVDQEMMRQRQQGKKSSD
ncbi:MAG TPA: YceI family protein [Candidatus Acidoferrales bacterium]